MLTISHNFFNILPSNKSAKDAGQVYSKRRYIFGLFLLLLVNILWVVSSELTKYIYTDLKLERPFLVTYLRSSLLVLYLVVLCFTPPTRDPCRPVDYTQLVEPGTETDEDIFYNESNSSSLGDSTFVPVRAGEATDSDDAAPRAVRFNKVAEVRVMSASQAGEALLARLSWSASLRACEHAQRRAAAAATRRHLRLALYFAAPWFVSNYLYRLGLSLAPASVVAAAAAAAAPAALALGAVAAQVPQDKFTLVKFVAVLLGAGGFVASLAGGAAGAWRGAAAAGGAALAYALHLVALRAELRRPEGVNAPLLAGLVGAASLSLAWCGGAALAGAGAEPPAAPARPALPALLLDAAAAPLIEALWLWACSLTSPQLATSSLCLTVPLPLLVEAWRGGGGGGAAGGAGALLAAAGWLLATHAGCAGTTPAAVSRAAKWLRGRLTRPGFEALRNIQDLDEQSESLISTEEPT